jgi:mono/diheme cytochrome c family protein
MKTRSKPIAVLALFASVLTWACAESSGPVTYESTGVITAIDVGRGSVTIDHKEIPGYMAAMEMSFPVSAPLVTDGFAVGDNVAFVLRKNEDKAALVKMTKAADTIKVSGSDVYAVNCSECHGPGGEGTKKGIPLISGHALAHTEKEFVEQVRNGEDDKMPAFRDKLSDEEIAAVVKYVRTVVQAGAKPDPKHKH